MTLQFQLYKLPTKLVLNFDKSWVSSIDSIIMFPITTDAEVLNFEIDKNIVMTY